MIKKMVVVIAASALAFGLSASSAATKTNAKAKPKATTVEAMKPVPGQNPTPVAAPQQPVKNVQPPQAIKGSNPMGVK